MRIIKDLRDRKFVYSVAVLLGTIVGVGVFAIPFSFAKAGFAVGFGFLIFAGLVTLLTNLIFGEVILRTGGKHQFVGYTGRYLGSTFKKVALFTMTLGVYAGLLAYIIVAGEFLSNVLSPFLSASITEYSVWFFAVGSVLVITGIKTVERVELFMAILFVVIMVAISVFGINKINLSHYTSFTPQFWFIPYGIMLSAFYGFTSIPIQRQILSGDEHKLKRSIYWAVFISAALYFLFGFTVLGLSGEATSPEAINGLVGILGDEIIYIASFLGLLTVGTSYLTISDALLDTFNLDYGINRRLAWLLTVSPPIVFFLGGLRNFIDVLVLSGAVAIGIDLIILILMHQRAKSRGNRMPEYSLYVPAWLSYLLIAVFVGGVIYELFIF